MNYSESFERDYNFYLNNINFFNFDGAKDYYKKSVEIYKNDILVNIMSFNSFVAAFPDMQNKDSLYSWEKIYNDFTVEVNLIAEKIVVFDKNGVTAKESFFAFDSAAKILPTKEPELLTSILKAKGSTNLHIKMYAEDLAKGLLSKPEIEDLSKELNAPEWFKEAIYNQKWNFYDNEFEKFRQIRLTKEKKLSVENLKTTKINYFKSIFYKIWTSLKISMRG